MALPVVPKVNCTNNTIAKNAIYVKGIKGCLNNILVDMVMESIKKGKSQLQKKFMSTINIP